MVELSPKHTPVTSQIHCHYAVFPAEQSTTSCLLVMPRTHQDEVCAVAGKASQKLVEAAKSHAGSLTVIASGPLTNVAHALQLDPDFVTNGMCMAHASPA